jgi:CxxC-x17-CxxC domain-containing protein
MFEDKTLVCKECNADFVFTAGEQEFYQEKGFTNEPKFCKPCRDARKGVRNERQRVEAVCAECGKTAYLNFQPNENRPVYCSDCYQNHRN